MKIIRDFPYPKQAYSYDCGASALQAVLVYYGYDVQESLIRRLAGTTKKNGTPVLGFKKVAQYFHLPIIIKESLSVKELWQYLDHGQPVILDLQAYHPHSPSYKNDWQDGHYVVAIGYDRRHVYLADPASVLRVYLTRQNLEMRWHDQDPKTGEKYRHLGIIIQKCKSLPKFKPLA